MLAKDIRHEGGYYEFVSLLLSRGASSGLEYFRVGRPVENRRITGMVAAVPSDHYRLVALLSRKRFQSLLFNTSFRFSSFMRDALLVMTAIAFRAAIVIQVHGWDEGFADSVRKKRLLRWLFAMSFGRADRIIVLAERFKRQLVEFQVDPERIRIGTTMFDGSLLRGHDGRKQAERVRLLFMSRLEAEKGANQILIAFREILKRHPTATLTIAGDGPERSALQARANQWGLQANVRFPGYVRGSEKADLLLMSDVFVLPTVYGEGMPIAMLEALAAGLPVVVTRSGAIGEMIVDGEHGALLDGNEPWEIAAAVERLMSDPLEMRAIGSRNREFAWSRFEASTVTRDVIQVCRSVRGSYE